MRVVFLTISICFLPLIAAIPTTKEQARSLGTLVDLGYIRYEGVQLPMGVNQYLGMRYAAPPLGDLRFRAPQDPLSNDTTQDATQHGPICYATGAGYANNGGQSEDCLFLDVYTPSNATVNSSLPVLLWIQGGGYVANAGPNFNGSGIVNASEGSIIVVTFNYRVGVFGFLASEEVAINGDLNVGLLDQRKAMQWVQSYIGEFGGNPNHVVLVGESAGAGSIAMHLIAYGGRDDKLFVGAIAESVFFPTQPQISDLEFQYDEFVNATGCTNSNNTVECLRSLDSETLQTANVDMPYPGQTSDPIWNFTPCIDGQFIQDYPYKLYEQGKFIPVPTIFGDDTDEGTVFAVNAASPSDISNFFTNNFPLLTPSDTAAINSQYPLGTASPNHNAYFSAAAAAEGESTFTCPGLLISNAYIKYSPNTTVWNYRYNVLTPENAAAGHGVPHGAELPAVWGPEYVGGSPAYTTTDASIVPVVQGYWISFVQSLDPNVNKAAGAPQWQPFTGEQRLLLQTNASTMENIPQDQVNRCAFWQSLSITMQQ